MRLERRPTYPYDPNPFWRGSRVIYPLSSEAILVLTHVEHADDPSRQKAKRPRRNARSHDHVLLSYTDVVNERELSDEEVITINYAIKMRAARWIASISQDHLYPERMLAPARWCEIDKLFYNEFSSFRSQSEIMVKYKDGTIMHSNAFGERDVVPGWFVRQQERRRD